MKKIVILYHANCEDGFSAAWTAWKKFSKKADYIPITHQEPHPKNLKNKELYLLDFAYPLETTKHLIQENKSVTILDHHITSKNNLKSIRGATMKQFSNATIIFNNDHSGAVIAWNYFHPKKKLPKLLGYVEDTDLWKFKKKNSKEIFAVLGLQNLTFKEWDTFAKKVENKKTRKEIIGQGKTILAYQKKLTKLIARRAEKVKIQGKKARAVNSPILASEVGNELATNETPIGITWFRAPTKLVVSLRSNGKVDVSKIAEKFGGGGHKCASSFRLPKNAKLPWNVV